jgi:predicted CoA-binding protein
MNQKIQEFVERKEVAVIGASRNGNKFGNAAAKELQNRGYDVYYIHPEADEIDGSPVYPTIDSVKNLVDTLLVSVSANQGMEILREAADAGLTKIWLQQGAGSPELLAYGEELGLEIISGKCILMYAEPVRSFHKFHQLIWKWIGQY